jgi:hypothetical protein
MVALPITEKVDVMVAAVRVAGLLSLLLLNFAPALKERLGLFGALIEHSPI